jgi:hypothetical protein
MATLAHFAYLEITFLLTAYAAVIGYMLLTGRITTRGMLAGKNGRFDPSRLQLLFFTSMGAFIYLVQVLGEGGGTLPAPPDALVGLVAGSNGLYLATKGYASRVASNLSRP